MIGGELWLGLWQLAQAHPYAAALVAVVLYVVLARCCAALFGLVSDPTARAEEDAAQAAALGGYQPRPGPAGAVQPPPRKP